MPKVVVIKQHNVHQQQAAWQEPNRRGSVDRHLLNHKVLRCGGSPWSIVIIIKGIVRNGAHLIFIDEEAQVSIPGFSSCCCCLPPPLRNLNLSRVVVYLYGSFYIPLSSVPGHDLIVINEHPPCVFANLNAECEMWGGKGRTMSLCWIVVLSKPNLRGSSATNFVIVDPS